MDATLQKMLLKKASALLARRSYSRGELEDRLSKTAGQQPVDAILDYLEQLNLLNDAEYAYNFAFYRMKDEGWGPAKVHNSLLRQRVSHKNIREALERVRRELGEEFALVEHLQRHCRKKGPPTEPKELRKLISHLRRRGFDDNIIFRTLERVIPTTVLRKFETGE
jgi:SOS response regulatory protein OraA/RecX